MYVSSDIELYSHVLPYVKLYYMVFNYVTLYCAQQPLHTFSLIQSLYRHTCERASLPHRWHPEPLQSLDGRLSSVALAGSLSPTLHSAAARSLLDDQTNSCSWCFRATDAVT